MPVAVYITMESGVTCHCFLGFVVIVFLSFLNYQNCLLHSKLVAQLKPSIYLFTFEHALFVNTGKAESSAES